MRRLYTKSKEGKADAEALVKAQYSQACKAKGVGGGKEGKEDGKAAGGSHEEKEGRSEGEKEEKKSRGKNGVGVEEGGGGSTGSRPASVMADPVSD